MLFCEAITQERIIDLNYIAPIGDMQLTNCQATFSLDGQSFCPIEKDDTARYIHFTPNNKGEAHAVIFAGRGFVAVENDYFTDVLKRREEAFGWHGADGIYTFNLTNGKDSGYQAGSCTTLFTFGDTLVSGIEKGTVKRTKPLYMPNNTFAILKGEDAKADMTFHIAKNEKGEPKAVFMPKESAYPYQEQGIQVADSYFWLQDGVVIGKHLYTIASLITGDDSQPEGFKFKLLGTVLIDTPIANDTIDYEHNTQCFAPLYYKDTEKEILYGPAIMPNTKESAAPNPDGYIYIYGHVRIGELRSLTVARVTPESFPDFTKWRYFNGESFVEGIENSKGILDHVSCEMSVSPLMAGASKGKYIAVFQYDTNSEYMAYGIGESPFGPFSKAKKVYFCKEHNTPPFTYCYNAKAHPHLSTDGMVLASYNVNNTKFEEHIKDATLYRPHFLELHDTACSDWDLLFANSYTQRVALFRAMNPFCKKGEIVFAGDSITQEAPVDELYGFGRTSYNRGIGGDTTKGLLNRLNESIIDLSPEKAFILMGTNDLATGQGTMEETIQQLIANMKRIIERVKKELPECKLHILSLLPINNTSHPKINKLAPGSRANEVIRDVNDKLSILCESLNTAYIDLHSKLADKNGDLKLCYTKEGLHISPEGYLAMAEKLKPYIAE